MAGEPRSVVVIERGRKGFGRRGAVGRVAARALRPRRLDQGVGPADRAESQHDPGGVALGDAAELSAGAAAGSKLDPFKDEIHRLLQADPRLPGQRVRELIEPLGFDGGKTIVDDYLREVRPLFAPPRTFQRTVYRPGEICQFDLWEPARRSRSGTARRAGLGRDRRAWATRARAPARWSSPRRSPDLLFGIRRCLWSLGGAAARRWSGTARPGCTPAAGARPRRSPRFCGAAEGRLALLRRRAIRRPRASSSACRTSPRRSFEPGRIVRERARLPAPARRAGSTSARTRGCTRRCAAGRSTG